MSGMCPSLCSPNRAEESPRPRIIMERPKGHQRCRDIGKAGTRARHLTVKSLRDTQPQCSKANWPSSAQHESHKDAGMLKPGLFN